LSVCSVKPVKVALALGALLAAAALAVVFVTTLGRDPASCALERLASARGWRFEEIIDFGDVKVLVVGNVSLATQELLTSITAWRAAAAENRIVYSNATHSMVLVEGGWVSRRGGWRLEDTVLYRLLLLARDSPERSAHALGDTRVVEFRGPCRSLCLSLFSELRSLAQSSAPEPESYSGRFIASGCTPLELTVDFESNGSVAKLSYKVTSFDVPVSVKP